MTRTANILWLRVGFEMSAFLGFCHVSDEDAPSPPVAAAFCADRPRFAAPVGGLWEKELGIFLRFRVSFDALRKHMRKFTRVQYEKGKWYSPRCRDHPVGTALSSFGNRPELKDLISHLFSSGPSFRIILQPGFGSWFCLQAPSPAENRQSHGAMTPEQRGCLHLSRRAVAPHGVIDAITGLPQECADLQKG